jgi:hypothetical protein
MARTRTKAKAGRAAKSAPKSIRSSSRRKTALRSSRRAKTLPKQRFTVSHHNEQDFKEGLRPYAKYRDLGIRDATGGMVQAHVIRFMPPFRAEEVSKRHYHDVDFQMVYVLKGWIKSEFEGEGEKVMHAGSCWIQPPRIKHTVLGFSDDCEVLEIILPAEFETVEV